MRSFIGSFLRFFYISMCVWTVAFVLIFTTYNGEYSKILEYVFAGTFIILVAIWAIVIVVLHIKFKNIIKNNHPDTFKKLGTPTLFNDKMWLPYVVKYKFKQLGDSELNWYGVQIRYAYNCLVSGGIAISIIVNIVRAIA